MRVPCLLRIADADGRREFVGTTVNVSSSGLAIQAAAAPGVGARVEVQIARFNEPPLVFAGRVAHLRRILGDEFEIGLAGFAL
ncbi:PilZ domain protein [Phycisphaerae bacterium RAS1]|nr:PilZ domain protein [Phycisphaerae bacterium RAS1]